jgi:hypothetical protein
MGRRKKSINIMAARAIPERNPRKKLLFLRG